ncbi:CPBP family intramembrane glutamic endopeptidase [Marinisporobacter balticus]|uniref:CAAX prenyl protease 2/Lysostaphin resistance protein A-like domain-containing protein n=1 Tax=Marinisporobacter balticus TaxID=2018667 RepID=A0A4R2KR69_9FIRM|nr:CPBP family intramembrane glutamic endopeptidase [Marinisporobacter balticus]TCO75242.1 hypothetical protein EV214_10979 [Marinisporobacter balticus]
MNSKRNVIFLSFTFAVTWATHWILAYIIQNDILQLEQSLSQLLLFVGGSGPIVAAYVAIAHTKDEGDQKEFHSRVLKVKVNYKWHLMVVLTPVVLGGVAVAIGYFCDNQSLVYNPIEPFYLYIPAFLNSIIAGGIEEFGWRGVVLPELLKKYNAMIATVILGVIWALWHLPLFYIPGTGQFEYSFIIFILSCIGISGFLTWIYVNTKSIFLCVVFHASLNASGIIGLTVLKSDIIAYVIYTILEVVIGLLLLMNLDKNNTEIKQEAGC